MSTQEDIFSTILASTVHDMKNSLGMMLDALNVILENTPDEVKPQMKGQHSIVRYESSRVNSALMQLLALYKIENNQLPFNPSYHNLYDFIEEQIYMHLPLFESKGFSYQIEIDDELEIVFDETLLSMAISNVIGNAIRYTKSQILIKCHSRNGTLISICDDGPGYPQSMIEQSGNYIRGINQSTGSTGLGLFFTQKVAEMHSHAGKVGFINLDNGGELGGGIFSILVP